MKLVLVALARFSKPSPICIGPVLPGSTPLAMSLSRSRIPG